MGSFSIWQHLQLSLENFICHWANTHCLKLPNIKQIITPSGHTELDPDEMVEWSLPTPHNIRRLKSGIGISYRSLQLLKLCRKEII